MYISGNLNENHATYGNNVNNWINFSNNKIIAVTEGYGEKNIFLKVRDIF